MKQKDINKRTRTAQSRRSVMGRLLLLSLLLFTFLGGAKAQQTLPYSYGFEDGDLSTDGWTAQITYSYSGINSAAAYTGNNGFRFYYDENPGYLVSPLLDGGTNGIDVSFWYAEYSSTYGNEHFQVGYTTDANETDPSNFTYGEIIEATTSWQQHTETLPAGTVRMAIKYLYVDALYLYLDDFTFEASGPCAKPTNLAVTTDGQTATVTWDGTADNNFIVTVNGGTPVTGQTSPYTFNVALSTTYEVVVVADYGALGTSNPVSTSFTTADCLGGHVITYALSDSYGDGWNGNAINIVDECGNLIETLTIASGSSNNGTLSLCGDYYQFTWTAGSYANEASFTLLDNGVAIYSNQAGGSLTDGQVLYTIGTNTKIPKPTDLTAGTPGYDNVDLSWTENGTATAWEICINGDESNLISANSNVNFNLTGLQPDNSYSIQVRAVSGDNFSCWSNVVTVTTPVACARPTDLTEANITFTTADLSWTGTSDSYVAEYGVWTQVGTDQTVTGTMTSYPFDLSGFSGKGTIAIRHYNVNDQFRLNVDDIVVKDVNGNIVYSENFESGSIPANMSNIDLDGDGNIWDLVDNSSSYVNGSYGVTSASWQNQVVLYPDNWLVISDVTLGGSITIDARGQDASAAAENFGVFVIADNQLTEAYSGNGTSCQVTGLTEGTAYAWRVQGDCGQYQSNWVFSMFKTPDDLLIFANEGNWDVLSNWTDIDGNAATALPTATNKVRIDADATIPAGVIATAKNATLNGGSITIEDGGQLKQGGSVYVTMYKGITGYGAGNEADAEHYNLIATPHNCSYLEENSTFPYVLNLTGDEYDLYAFDVTADLEWINYESNSSHTEFHQGSNTGLFNKKAYLYANADDTDLTFVGTVSSSLNNTLTESYTYSATSTNAFNGWKLIGNPFTCNAYVYYTDEEDNQLPATFYKMNAEGDGLEEVTGMIELAPFEGAFIVVSESGKIVYSSEPVEADGEVVSVAMLPLLPEHGLDADQDAEPFTLTLQNDNEENNLLIMDYHGATVNVALAGRTLWKDGNWNTLTLPFNVDITSSDCLLAGADVRELVDAEYDGTTLQLTFTGENEVDMIQAGIPYIIKWDSGTNIEDPVFNNVTINSAVSNKDFDLGDGNSITFKGTYDLVTFPTTDQHILFLGENNTLYWPEPEGTNIPSVGACRAYFELEGFTTAETAGGMRFALKFGQNGGEATGIVSAKVSGDARDSWYTVDGVKLNGAPKRKGLYIHNGTKKVVK
jgi:hypothetical protein